MTDKQATTEQVENPAAIDPSSPTKPYVPDPTARFRGIGINFRGKLIGIDEVTDSRGDQMCQESLLKLKAAVKASGQHKQKIVINVSLDGIKIIDMLSGQVEHTHPVHRISFISRDLTDRRAFGYVYGLGDGDHQFFGIKTLKIAEQLVLALRDLFQVVYDLKKKEMDAKDSESTTTDITPTKQAEVESSGLVDLQNELKNIKEGIETIDAIPAWAATTPTTDAGFSLNESSGDMFGANLSDISSLSSEFSCASNTIVDYGYAGGGKTGNNFVRTGSSRSEQSLQGNLNQSLRSSTKSRMNNNENGAITEENELNNKISDTHSDTGSSKNSAKVSSDDNSFSNEVMNATAMKSEKKEPKDSPNVKSASTDDVSSTDSKSKHRTSKKNTAFGGLFKSKSEKGKKRKSKKHSDATSSASSIGSKSEDDKFNNKFQLRASNTSLSAQSTPAKKQTLSDTGVNQLERTHSHNSINSSKSYTVASTEKMKRGNSNTSLMSAPGNMDSNKRSLEQLHNSIGLAIEQKKASLKPRPRPNVKHKSTNDENSDNPPMFKVHHTDNITQKGITEKPVSEEQLKANFAKWENLDDSFGKFDDLKNSNQESKESLSDPFAELEKQEIPVSNSVEGFGDSAWADFDMHSKSSDKVKVAAPHVEDPFADDPFKDEPVDNTHGINEGNTNSSDPFDKIDPFTLDMDENENLFIDPFENVSLEDAFQDSSNSNDVTLTENTLKFNIDNGFSSDDLSAREPTFPEGSEDIIAKNKRKEKDFADSSSITSGLSTPIHNPSSPIHAPDIAKVDAKTPKISSTPPPLPPRRRKVASPIEDDPVCPAIPPPPLPDGVKVEEDNDILPPNFAPPALPPDVVDLPDAPIQPPAIPLRKNESPMSNSPWENFPNNSHTTNHTLAFDSQRLSNSRDVEIDVSPGSESTSSSSIWPQSTQSSDDRDSNNYSTGTGSDVPNGTTTEKDSYSNDLMGLTQAPKLGQLSNDQILAGFGPSQPTSMGMFGNQGMGGMNIGMGGMNTGMGGMSQGMGGMGQTGYGMQQPGMMGMQQGGTGMMQGQQGMQFGQSMQAGFGVQPGFNAGGMPQTAPSIPPRRPPPTQPMDPFGGVNNSNSMFPSASNNSLLSPKSTQPKAQEEPKKSDPFADLGAMTGIASTNSSSKKDMFKDFKMAKPQAPPRTSINKTDEMKKSSSSNLFNDYFANNVGGIQIDDANNNMSATKTQQADAFLLGGAPAPAPRHTSTNDGFGGDFGSFNFDTPSTINQPTVQNANNLDSLFG